MSNIRLTGSGAPTRRTVGVVGQHYEDTTTGNIYECLVASEYSKLNGTIGGGYVWKLKYSGEDRKDHEDIFGAGGSSNQVIERSLIEDLEVKTNNGTIHSSGYAVYSRDNNFQLDINGVYKFEWNGVVHSVTTWSIDIDGVTVIGFGNKANVGKIVGDSSYEDTGEPYAMINGESLYDNNYGIQFYGISFITRAEDLPYTVSLYKIEEIREKFDILVMCTVDGTDIRGNRSTMGFAGKSNESGLIAPCSYEDMIKYLDEVYTYGIAVPRITILTYYFDPDTGDYPGIYLYPYAIGRGKGYNLGGYDSIDFHCMDHDGKHITYHFEHESVDENGESFIYCINEYVPE